MKTPERNCRYKNSFCAKHFQQLYPGERLITIEPMVWPTVPPLKHFERSGPPTCCEVTRVARLAVVLGASDAVAHLLLARDGVGATPRVARPRVFATVCAGAAPTPLDTTTVAPVVAEG